MEKQNKTKKNIPGDLTGCFLREGWVTSIFKDATFILCHSLILWWRKAWMLEMWSYSYNTTWVVTPQLSVGNNEDGHILRSGARKQEASSWAYERSTYIQDGRHSSRDYVEIWCLSSCIMEWRGMKKDPGPAYDFPSWLQQEPCPGQGICSHISGGQYSCLFTYCYFPIFT